MTPGAPISVQRRGGRYRAFTIACTGADVVAGARARVVTAQEVVRAGASTCKQAMQMCSSAGVHAGVCACQVVRRA